MSVNRSSWMLFWAVGLALLLVFQPGPIVGEEIRVVVPNDLEDVDGGTINTYCCGPLRVQQAYPAEEFASLPQGKSQLIRFAFRPDERVGGPRTVSFDNLLIRFSTTGRDPVDLSNTFAENIGPDATIVFDGPLTIHTDNVGPPGGPKDFDYIFDLQPPFLYDPSEGNLLWDISYSAQSAELLNDGLTPDIFGGGTLIGAFDTEAEVATRRGDGLVTEFTFAPLGMLQAGDADQDLDFDQLDLVQVQITAKYLAGQPATWGEGDWDGAPGGEPGNPPPGNGLFDQFDVIAALGVGTYLTGPYAAVQPNGQLGDGQTSLIYNAGTGEVAVDTPAGVELTSINIDSAAGIFTGVSAQNLGGSFDNDADNNIFKATFGSSFGSLSFGNVAQAGLSEDFVLGDLSVVGSLAGGGDLGTVDLVYVPEPTTALLLAVGLVIGLLHFRRADR